MKERPNGFITENKINQEGEIFDYIRELHEYLWRFTRVFIPAANGSLSDFVDEAVKKGESLRKDKIVID